MLSPLMPLLWLTRSTSSKRRLIGKLETAVLQQGCQDLVDGTGLPEPLKDERRSNVGVARGHAVGMRMRAEEDQLFREARERLHQRVELAAGEEFVEATEAGQDAQLDLAVGPDVIDEKLGVATLGRRSSGRDEGAADLVRCGRTSSDRSPRSSRWL